MDWIGPAKNKDRWWVLVNAAMNFGFHKLRGNNVLLTVHHSETNVTHFSFIFLIIKASTCFEHYLSSGAFGILRAYNISCLWHN
jgi:hypothetical protein